MAKINPVRDTWLKLSPDQAKQLPPNQKRSRVAHDPLAIVSVEHGEADHWRVHFSSPGLTIGDGPVTSCLIWPDDWEGVGEVFAKVQALNTTHAIAHAVPIKGAGRFVRFRDQAGKVIEAVIKIGYKSQMDNRHNPTGSCNVTSIAMALEYFGITATNPNEIQLEDELYQAMERSGLSRHSPHDLAKVAEIYGMRDRFTSFAKLSDIKASIASGRPCIFHGWFTSFGHIIVAVGYDETGFWVHDPYGKWTPNGYIRNGKENQRRGEYVHYSYGMIDAKCREKDGSFWCHFLDRADWQPQATPIAPLKSKPTGLSRVTIVRKTSLKSDWTKQAIALPPGEVYNLAEGKAFECVVTQAPNGHVMLTLPDDRKLFGRDVWYGFALHLKIETPGGISLNTPGTRISHNTIAEVAAAIGIDARVMQAVIEVECEGSGFLPSGRCKILFEAHWFGYYTNDAYSDSHPNISSRTWNRALYKGGDLEWGRLEQAAALDKEAAYQSASWGLGQVMGFHWEKLGYKSVLEFADRMQRSEGEQLLAMAKFIQADDRLMRALKARDWEGFAFAYNGEGYKANQYDTKLAAAYAAIG